MSHPVSRRPVAQEPRWGAVVVGLLGLLLTGVAGGACGRNEVSGPAGAEPPNGHAAPEAPGKGSAEKPPEGNGSSDADQVAKAQAAPEPPPPGPERAGACPESSSEDVGILVTPAQPTVGEPLRILAATFVGEEPLSMRIEGGPELSSEDYVYRPGVPAATLATTAPKKPGTWTVVVGREGEGLACTKVSVGVRGKNKLRPATDAHVWPVSRSWDGAEEALFSAWVREMFHAPRTEELAWEAMHQVTSDPERNLLHDHYGWGEDDEDLREGLYLKPDCADTPYFLRAYFAWKRELPFGHRRCSRGGAGKAPYCGELRTVVGKPENPPDTRKPGELGAVQRFFRRTLAWGVHTGNGRTALKDDETDFYPVELSRKALRPGTIYADPYGHIFVMVEFVPAQEGSPGVLYAIDGQPDGSITRKRFWEGNFLFNPDPALGGSGFKAFRPLLVEKGDDGPVVTAATNEQIQKMAAYGDLSYEQGEIQATQFYDRMDALITPGRRDPFAAQKEAVRALYEAAKVRLTSVENGEEYLAKSGGAIDMPDGYSIFETTGAWENFSTPARDLRLLIAIDVVTSFARKVARNEDVFETGGRPMNDVARELAEAREKLLADPDLAFEYRRSDGSKWSLSLTELIDRADALEMGYNPNDCPEVRWGAPEGSKERSTCERRAPTQQRKKMSAYRVWFDERRRPARGDPGPPVP